MDGFEKIWEEFSYVIEEMRDGMGFFEGFILDVAEERFDAAIHTLCSTPLNAQLSATWSNETTKADRAKKYNTTEYLQLFHAGKVVTLKPQLNTVRDGIPLEMMLMIEKWDDQMIIEIICYRENYLIKRKPKNRCQCCAIGVCRNQATGSVDQLCLSDQITSITQKMQRLIHLTG